MKSSHPHLIVHPLLLSQKNREKKEVREEEGGLGEGGVVWEGEITRKKKKVGEGKKREGGKGEQ